jgi:hypothetical protein
VVERRLQVLKDGVEIFNELFATQPIPDTANIVPPLQFQDSSFDQPINPWQVHAGPDVDNLNWTYISNLARSSGATGGDAATGGSKFLCGSRLDSALGWPPGDYIVAVRCANTSTELGDPFVKVPIVIGIYGTNDDGATTTFLAEDTIPGNGFSTLKNLSFTSTVYFKEFCFRVHANDVPYDIDMHFDLDSVSMSVAPTHDVKYTVYSKSFLPSALDLCDSCAEIKFLIDGDEEYFSDLIYFPTETEWLQIKYKSSFITNKIPWNGTEPFFNLFVNAQFAEERDITQTKEVQLSNTVLSTASTLAKQRRLEMVEQGAPDYFLRKLSLVLQHSISGQVSIDNVYWVFPASGMEKKERPETYPFHRGLIWLTEKDYFQTNQI